MKNKEILFISDCHLDVSRPDLIQHFIQFIKNRATQAKTLYILGDLFEVWLGDDDPAEGLTAVFDALIFLQKTCKTFFIAGNRDFLVGSTLTHKLGIERLTEPTIITLNNKKTALLHGDSLCSDDVEYQNFKKIVRSEAWQKEFLAMSLEKRRAIASQLRADSKTATQNKKMAITDTNRTAVLDYFKQHHVSQIIHGHTHRPAIHHYNEQQLTRYVLGDWQPTASYLSVQDGELTLHDERV
ncbi:MAG: UDP-2,3-diacylglucosamine diphosphatase [Gammaproteobacteria bacterium]|nr:UDP-2,3-diacylglucosamine diphosphatase [Gammaproteobacteria bacterium]